MGEVPLVVNIRPLVAAGAHGGVDGVALRELVRHHPPPCRLVHHLQEGGKDYKDTSLIRNSAPLGSYSRKIPGDLRHHPPAPPAGLYTTCERQGARIIYRHDINTLDTGAPRSFKNTPP